MILSTIAKPQLRVLELMSMIEAQVCRQNLTSGVAAEEDENLRRTPVNLLVPKPDRSAVRLAGLKRVMISRSIQTISITIEYIDIPKTPVTRTKRFAQEIRSRAKETIAGRKRESFRLGKRPSREWLNPISRTILDLQVITVPQTNGAGVDVKMLLELLAR
jgi:hypothetical protein